MKLEWRGQDKLMSKFERNIKLEMAKKIVKHHGAEMENRMKHEASFNRGYQTGQTKRSIKNTITNGGLTTTTRPDTDYASYLEYGTRFMSEQPFVRPAHNVQKELFKDDMDRLV